MSTALISHEPNKIYLQYQASQSILREQYSVIIEDGEDGMLIAKCPKLDVITQGKTENDALRNVIECIELMLDELGQAKEFSVVINKKG